MFLDFEFTSCQIVFSTQFVDQILSGGNFRFFLNIYRHAYIKYIVRFPINDWSLTGLPVEHICLLYRAHLLYFNIPLIIIFKIARCMVWPRSVHCRSEQQCFANGVCFNNVVEFWR